MPLVFVSEKAVARRELEVQRHFLEEPASTNLVSKMMVMCCLVIEDILC
jgi:hypothetical protein